MRSKFMVPMLHAVPTLVGLGLATGTPRSVTPIGEPGPQNPARSDYAK